jgi:hypothetical protein
MRTILFFASAILPFSLLSAQELGWVSRSAMNIAKPASDGSSSNALSIRIRDKCDPATFNAPPGPGGCVGDGNVTLTEFLAELTEDRAVGAWRFSPDQTDATLNQTVLIDSRGGETHTFTHVSNFGGGIVGLLNTLSGNPVPAMECATVAPDKTLKPAFNPSDLVFPGAMKTGPVLAMPGEQKFQCCIHPWMRTTLNVQTNNNKGK